MAKKRIKVRIDPDALSESVGPERQSLSKNPLSMPGWMMARAWAQSEQH